MIARRLTLSFILLLVFAGLWMISVVRSEFSHTYHHWLDDARMSESNVPVLTACISLPILGDELHLSTGRRPVLFYVYWSLLWLCPIAICIGVWSIREPQRLREMWLYSFSLYVTAFVVSALFILAGLWLPFSLT